MSQKNGRGAFRSAFRGTNLSATVGLTMGISLCAGALLCGPLSRPVWAAPTIGGDENGPQVQILQPAYQDVLKGKTNILIAVKANKFNPQFVEMFIDDKPATPGPIALAAMPSANYNWDTKLFSDGPHKLMVRITDTQGFRGWAEVNIFVNNQKKIDTTPPSLKWQNAPAFQQLSGTTSIQLDALDNFGVKWLFISLAKASDPSVKVRSWMLNRPPYTVKFDTTLVPDGVYQLSAKAYDSFEQEGEAPSVMMGIVNSAINATTIGDMLAGLKRVADSNLMTTPAKTGNRFTLPAPDANSNASASARASIPSVPAPRMVSPNSAAPRVAAKAAATTGTKNLRALPPMLPPMVVKTPVIAKTPASATTKAAATVATPAAPALTKVPTTVAKLAPVEGGASNEFNAPQFSSRAGVTAQRSQSDISREIDGALNEDWRARFARVGTPEAGMRSVSGAPILSGNASSDNSRRAALAPLKVEAQPSAPTGRLSKPATRFAQRDENTGAEMPQISAPDAAPQTKISGRQGLSAKIEALKAPRAAKGLQSAPPRLAALPRPTSKGAARGAINAITVSPLQISVSDALPAFHTAARATDVRAVAARYGLPPEVLAANNGWEESRTIAAGERVKLPARLKVAYHGMPVEGDVPSMLVGGTGVTAFRFMFEKAGGKLVWDAKKQQVVARKGNSEVVLSIGSNRAKVGDKDVMLELAAFLFEGRTMVPVRFFEEGLKAQVEWDPQTGRLVVAMAG